MVNLTDAVNRIVKLKGLKSEKVLADRLGISAPDLSKRKKIGSLLPLLIDWAIAEKVNLDWMLTGEGHPYFVEPDTGTCANESLREYGPQGASFQDRQYAVDLEMHLVELERLSPEAYKKIGTYIKGVLDGIRMGRQSSGDRRQGERRTKDAPDQIPNGKDRRGGCDRRKGAV